MGEHEEHPFRAAPPETPARDPVWRLRLLPRMWAFVLCATLGTQLLSRGHFLVGGVLALVGFVGLGFVIWRLERG